MPATKKITDQIAEDIRGKYQTGDFTQSELADLFSVSVPTINKTVKGVKPEKRKYTHRSNKYAERDAEIVRMYTEDGKTTREIVAALTETGVKMTHQNVSLILKKNDINPRARYFTQLGEQKAERDEKLAEQKAAKRAAKEELVEALSLAWKAGTPIDGIREMAGLKSVNAAQVKIVNLRKKYGVEKFPKRAAFGQSAEKLAAAKEEKDVKVAELSKLWTEGADKDQMAAVFGWKPETVTRRIPKLRAEYGVEAFPYRRQPKAEVAEVGEDIAVEDLEFSAEA
jgi:transposase